MRVVDYPDHAAGNIMQILSNLPDFLRKPMLRSRLKEFLGMSEVDKKETIIMALSAAPTIDPAKLAILVKTWLEVVSELEPDKRMEMLSAYSRHVLEVPNSIQRLDLASLTKTFMSLDEKQRDKITDSIHEVLFTIPNGHQLLKLIPPDSLSALKLK
jgi:hypothetical protein